MQGHDGLDVVLFGDTRPAQRDGADTSGVGDFLTVAEEAEARGGECTSQHDTEHGEADPCALAGEDAGGLLQHHLRGEVAEERARELERQHDQEIIVRVVREHREQIADDERTADGEQIQEHGPQPSNGDDVAAALHLALAIEQKGQKRADEAHGGDDVEIREAAEIDADFVGVIRVPAPDHLNVASEDQNDRGEDRRNIEHVVGDIAESVDKVAEQLCADLHQNIDREVQHNVDERHGDGVAHDDAEQYRKAEEAEEGQHRRGHKLHTCAEIREADEGARAVGDERDEQMRTERDGKAAEQIRAEQALAPDGEGCNVIGRGRPEQEAEQHPCQREGEDRRRDDRGNGAGEDEFADVGRVWVPLGLIEDAQRQEQDPQHHIGQPDRKGLFQAAQEERRLKVRCF